MPAPDLEVPTGSSLSADAEDVDSTAAAEEEVEAVVAGGFEGATAAATATEAEREPSVAGRLLIAGGRGHCLLRCTILARDPSL